jgi:hypothetical protein
LTKIKDKKIIIKFMVLECNKGKKLKIPFDFILLEYDKRKKEVKTI